MLPGATETIFALGLGEDLTAVSHECDHPAGARAKPKVVKNRIPTERMAPAAVDRAVASALKAGESLYEIDLGLLEEARPDLIVTQDLCDVCAVTGTDLSQALARLGLRSRIVTQTPGDLQGIFKDILDLGVVLGVAQRARDLVEGLKARILRLKAETARLQPRKVYCMEWLDPPYACGHWVPELVEAAGGREVLGSTGPSRRVSWDEIASADPDVIVLMPCGYDIPRASAEARRLEEVPQWRALRAVREGKVHAVDANAYFSRPGPRVVEGAEILAGLLHPA